MAITLIFFLTMSFHLVLTLINYRAGVLVFFFFLGVYPRFFALGIGAEGFALTGQRAMAFMLFGLFIIRALWGSSETKYAYALMQKYISIIAPLLGYMIARLIGNFVTGRVDAGMVTALIGEIIFCVFIVYLILSCVRSIRSIFILLGVLTASLMLNQFVAIIEFITNAPIFPETLDLQYEINRNDVLEGKIRDERYRAMGLFDTSNSLGGMLVMLLPFVIAQIQSRYSFSGVFLGLIVISLVLPVAIFTDSRTAQFFCIAIIAWYMYQYLTIGMSRVGRLFVAAILGLICMAFVFLMSGVIDQMLFGEGYAGSTAYRYLQYVYGVAAFIESPLFGYGYARNIGDIVGIRPLDSFLLRVVLEGGLVALASFILFIVRGYKLAGTVMNSTNHKSAYSLAMAVRVALLSSIIIMFVQQLPQVSTYIFVIVGLSIVLHNLCINNNVLQKK